MTGEPAVQADGGEAMRDELLALEENRLGRKDAVYG